MRAWVNGQMLEDAATGAVSVLDHGFTVGDGVFEAVKVVHGQPFALTRHLRRLAGSAAGMGLPAPDEIEVRTAVDEVLALDAWELARLRITWTAGFAPPGSGRGQGPPTLAVVVAAMTPRSEPATVVTVPWPRNEHSAVVGLKTTSYAENVVALAYAAERGAEEAVFANTTGTLCEGTGSNVFYVVDGELRTPTLASGCLPGVTRALLLEWLGVREVDDPVEVLAEATEVFLASTTRDVHPVGLCDGRRLPAPGPLTREAARLWREREAADVDP